jgi:hypothetical protein
VGDRRQHALAQPGALEQKAEPLTRLLAPTQKQNQESTMKALQPSRFRLLPLASALVIGIAIIFT